MKRRNSVSASALALCIALGSIQGFAAPNDGMKKGSPDLQSAGPLAFGPDGVLFIGDPRGAAVVAVQTQDKDRAKGQQLNVKELGAKTAALLGTVPDEVFINDVAVNPLSGNVYLSIHRGRGPDAAPVLIRVSPDGKTDSGGKLEIVSLEDVHFATASLPNPPSPEAVGRRNRKLRLESITDLGYVDGRILVAGLSNEEFASTLRSIPFPFKAVDKGSSVEIYHGAHGKFETRSPVRTFAPYDIAGETHVLAAYTCTPLVKFALRELQPGKHVKGTTIAELGNRNRPLDMIVYEKGGKDYLLLANSKRGVMKVTTEDIATAPSIETRVARGERAGQPYESIEGWNGIQQLDRLDNEHVVVLQQGEDGKRHLQTLASP